MRIPTHWFLFLALTLSPPGVFSETITEAPVADTYFEAYGSENKNFGAEPVLRLDQWDGRQVFLRFALTNVPTTRHIARAQLRLFIIELGFNEQGEFPDLKTCVSLFDVATSWTEAGLTLRSPDGTRAWNQGPGIAGPKYADVGPLPKPDIGVHLSRHAVPLDPASVTNHSWFELDVTDFLRQRLRAGDKELNLLLRSSTLGRNYTFRSREAKEQAERPQLVVEVDDQLPDFSLEDALLTDWKPGMAVSAKLRLAAGPVSANAFSWSLQRMPATSRLAPQDVNATATGAMFRADVPGKYRLQAQAPAGRATTSAASATESADAYVLAVPPHPRLYVTAASLPELRQEAKTPGRLSRAFLAWVKNGSTTVGQGKFHDMGEHEGCENNSLAWLLTGDRSYLTNAMAYAQRVLAKPMREHFEDVHAATFLGASWVHAMAVHYDWCYDELSAAQRRAITDWLKEAASWGWVRSGSPIAHNDGGARQCLLGSAALALLGDDPEATELYRRSRENFEQRLLPWLNDGGRGGRSGDGGEYEGLHGFYIVKYAWMSQTATGEDIFSETPFFFNRLRHVLFGWYPRKLVERSGAYAMRQYYSPSGDHTRLGYVGDTQPYQSAAALCARFRSMPAAQAVRWLGGDWPTQWMQYTLRWAVLGQWEKIPAREPQEPPTAAAATTAPDRLFTSADMRPEAEAGLAYLDEGCNTMYARSDWSDDATWVLLENAPFVSAHDSLDSGTFEIFKGDLLAARTGNLDHANVGAAHTMNYLHRSIAGNCLLIEDPAEKWKGFLGGAQGGSDEGGERTNFPLSSSADADSFVNYRDIFLRGRIGRFSAASPYTYAFADLTPAYNNSQFHGGKLNRPKVKSVTRQLLYLRQLDSVVVFDRVESTNPDFKKRFLLHSLGDLEVLDGTGQKVDDGEFTYRGATRAVIRYGWPKPVPSFGRCLSVTLLPQNAEVVKIGGRTDLAKGKTETFPGDRWHGQHRHHHIKDFWVNGTNYPPGNPPETRWFGEPTSEWYVSGTPDESGGRGKWRLEVSPPKPAAQDVFFHVLCPRLGRDGSFPDVRRWSPAATGNAFDGALITGGSHRAAIFFSHQEHEQSRFSATLPDDQPSTLLVADLAPGTYRLTMGDRRNESIVVGKAGLLVLTNANGPIQVDPNSGL